MPYKRLKESDIEDLPVETGIIAQGSVVQVLRGGIIIEQQGYISYFMKLCFVYSETMVRKTIWYHPLISMIYLNPLATQD